MHEQPPKLEHPNKKAYLKERQLTPDEAALNFERLKKDLEKDGVEIDSTALNERDFSYLNNKKEPEIDPEETAFDVKMPTVDESNPKYRQMKDRKDLDL